MGELTVDFRSLNNTPLPDEAPEEPDEPEEPEEALHKSTHADPFQRLPIVRSDHDEPFQRLREDTSANPLPEYFFIIPIHLTRTTDRPLRVKSAAPAARKFRAEPNLTAASQRRGKWK